MDIVKKSLELHKQWKGKIEVISTVPVNNKQDLSLAYTPGVAEPCLEIQKDPDLRHAKVEPCCCGNRWDSRFGAGRYWP